MSVRSGWPATRGLLTVLPALWLGACAGDAAPPASAGPSFDTLANGSVLVTNPADGLWDANPDDRWRVVEGLRIGTVSGDGPDSFGQVGSIVVTEAGSLWIVDRQATEIRVFDADGAYVRTVGRSGEGPGEFESIGPAHMAPNGEIWVEDPDLLRFEIFDTTGTRVGGHRGVSSTRGGFSGWTGDGRLLVSEYDRDNGRFFTRAFRFNSEGLLDSAGVVEPPELEFPERRQIVFEYPSNYRIEQPMPFARSTGFRRGRGTDWWLLCGHCDDSSYDIIRMSAEGDTLLTIRRHYEPSAISDSVRAAALEPLERYVEGASRIIPRLSVDDVPRVYPPFDGGLWLSDDGTLWLRQTGPGGARLNGRGPGPPGAACPRRSCWRLKMGTHRRRRDGRGNHAVGKSGGPARCRRTQAASAQVLLFAVLVGACENLVAPESCGPIPQQTVHVGESASVPVCFNDEGWHR